MSDGKLCPEQMSGWLHKWANIIKGYQKRWFVLSSGLLSYYRSQDEAKGACRGTISLAGASVNKIDFCRFVVTNGITNVYLQACTETERQRWITALDLAKAKAIKKLETDDDSTSLSSAEEDPGREPLMELKGQLEQLNTTHNLVVKNNHQLLKQVLQVEEGDVSPESSHQLKERMVLFKVTAGAMVKASEEFLVQARNAERKWARLLQYERSQRRQLQESLESLGRQMHHFERRASTSVWRGAMQQLPPVASSGNGLQSSDATLLSHDVHVQPRDSHMQSGDATIGSVDSDDDDKTFFDAAEIIPADEWGRMESPTEFDSFHSAIVEFPTPIHKESEPPEAADQLPVGKENTMIVPVGPSPNFFENLRPTIANRRTTIPPKPDSRVSLWGILKNCIGMDLSKIPVPVNFNEPLSFLQRFVESLLHADLLEKAVACDNTLEENTVVVAFAGSSYYGTAMRLAKPFNPLLGETYECDRRAELGWRAFLEQVSHHPPMYATHVEHKDWTLWEEFTVASKFRGKYLSVYPIGSTHLVLHRSRSHYTWNRVTTTIHNIIVGTPWIDQSGEMKVTNHTTGEEGLLEFRAYSYFSSEQQRKVCGSVRDSSGKVRFVMTGHWDNRIESARVISGEGRTSITATPEVLWKAPLPESGNEQMYNFSKFTCSLNEPEEGVCLTDSRLRSDQRVMEGQDFDKANQEKVRLEEKQRAKRRKREAAAAKAAEAAATGNHEEAARLEKEAAYSPVWFQKEYDPLTNTMMHVYKGGYWEGKLKGDWGRDIPDLF